MAIYKGETRTVLYKGDYAPAEMYKGDVKLSGYKQEQYSGTEITAADTYNDSLDFTVYGKSEQASFTGKNLFCNKGVGTYDFTGTTSAVCEVLEDGSIYVASATNDATMVRNAEPILSTAITESGTYVVSETGKIKYKIYVVVGVVRDGTTTYYSAQNSDAVSYTVELLSGDTVNFYLRLAVGATVEDVTIYPQLEIGSTATDYEPYVGGEASLNYSYPQEIEYIENSVITSEGRNLIPFPYNSDRIADVGYTATVSGITFTVLEKGRIHAVGTATSNSYFHLSIVPIETPGFGAQSGKAWNNGTYSISPYLYFNSNTKRVHTYISKGTTLDTILEPMFVKGIYGGNTGIAMPEWVPYFEPTSVTVTEPLRSIGSVRDYIEVKDGKVTKVQNIFSATVSKDEMDSCEDTNFSIGWSGTLAKVKPLKLNGNYVYDTSTVKSNIGKKKYSVAYGDGTVRDFHWYIAYNTTYGTVINFFPDIDTASTFGEWSQANLTGDIVIDFQIEPIETDITDTELGQALLGMKTVPKYTRIYSVSDIVPELTADIKTVDKEV